MDSFDFDAVSSAWRSGLGPSERLFHDFHRHRRAMRLKVAKALAAVAVLGAALCYALAHAVHHGGAERWVAVAALAAAVPPSLYCLAMLLRRAGGAPDLSPEAVLAREQARLDVDRHAATSARIGAVILVVASAVVLALAALGVLDGRKMVMPVAIWVIIAAAMWKWQRTRVAALAMQRRATDRLVAQFRDADEADTRAP